MSENYIKGRNGRLPSHISFCPVHGLKVRTGKKNKWICRQCNVNRVTAYYKKIKKENPEKLKQKERKDRENRPFQNMKYTSGFTAEEYQQKWLEQNGVCAICKKPERFLSANGNIRKLAGDHNHSTGKHRGLLCGMCNTALGKFDDNILILESAISYLKRWN